MGSQLNRCLRKETFRTRSRPIESLLKAPERPSHKIEVKLLLEKKIDETIFRNLDIALGEDGMEITARDKRNKVITVRGTPPEHGYNADSVLAVVKQHDSQAQILSQKVLSS